MTIFLNNFFDKILAKYSLKRIKLHHFLKFSWGVCPRTPLANEWLCHALRMARSAMQIPPLFQKNFEPPPPK